MDLGFVVWTSVGVQFRQAVPDDDYASPCNIVKAASGTGSGYSEVRTVGRTCLMLVN